MIVRSTNVDVRSDVVSLDVNRFVEEAQGLAESTLVFQGVANVVVEFGVAVVDLQARHENGVLVDPVVVSYKSLCRVCEQQRY